MTFFLRNRAHARTVRALGLSVLAAITATRGGAQSTPLRVLFIGNSYTYVNDLPSVIGDLARAAHESRRFDARTVLVGGATLERHLAQPDALTEIARGGWDFVVLQEQSQRPIAAPTLMWRDVQRLADATKKAGAKLLLYETWARETAPVTQDSLSRSYHHAAELTGATLAHVGEAWAAFRSTESVSPQRHSALFMDDGSHPSPVGTYLAACCRPHWHEIFSNWRGRRFRTGDHELRTAPSFRGGPMRSTLVRGQRWPRPFSGQGAPRRIRP